ncbi:hypothetical protein D3C86_1943360 [compost metagenome]
MPRTAFSAAALDFAATVPELARAAVKLLAEPQPASSTAARATDRIFVMGPNSSVHAAGAEIVHGDEEVIGACLGGLTSAAVKQDLIHV